VLVVEDFTITAKMLERMLTKDGYTVHVARSGEMALELYRRQQPDMLLIDLNLPGMTGSELLEALLSTGNSAPSIVVTGEKDDRKLRGLKKYGVMRVFRKPIIQDELLSYIGGYFSRDATSGRVTLNYQVLLAMADEAAANVLKSALNQQRLEAKIVTDGYQAVHELAGSPRVAVVDVVIGGLDGTEVIRRTLLRTLRRLVCLRSRKSLTKISRRS
jgi:CheY-like chemotaxis protein